MGKPAKKNLPADARVVIASAENDITIPFFSNVLQPNDDTIAKKGKGKGLALYDEIERDTHAWAVLQKRKKNLVAREWIVKPGGESPLDLAASEFCEEQLRDLPFDRICEELLDATLKGFAITEIVWGRDGARFVVDRILNHDQRRFIFDADWKARLLTRDNSTEGVALPERKFMVHRHGVKGNNPFGLGLGTRLFWPVLFKREGVSFWMTFLEKFAAPTVVGKGAFGLSDTEEKKLLSVLSGFVQNSAILLPAGVEADFLEASRSGTVSYHDWCKYWDSQMSICVLGETLTTEITGHGSRAATEVHADILELLVDADADLLSDTLRDTLLRWLTEYNFPGAAVPHVRRIRASNERAEAETDEKKAVASMARDEALRQVTVSAAVFEDNDDARDFIQTMTPMELSAEMLDRLVAVRVQMRDASAETGKKKDPQEPELVDDPQTGEFAELDVADEAETQAQLTDQLEDLSAAWADDRFGVFRSIIDRADTLEGAAKAALTAYTEWNAEPYASVVELGLNAAAYAGRSAVLAEIDDARSFADVDVFGQPFREQIAFFRQKELRPTAEWTDVLRGDHDRAFMIAGAKDLDMLADFQRAIAQAMEDGTGLAGFRKDFDKIVAKFGWSYKGERGWRSRVIFETNVRTSYMAGRLKQMRDPDVLKARPFWQYVHGLTRKPKVARRQHLAWNGLVLNADDPWWDQHFPPNDWKCSCGVFTRSRRDLERLGKSGPDDAPPTRKTIKVDQRTKEISEGVEGIGFGWEYQPGDLWERGLVPSQIDRLAARAAFTVDDAEPIAELIAKGRAFKAKELVPGQSAEAYVKAFLKSFGATLGTAVLFKDKAGGVVPISDELFRNARGELKVLKRGREVHSTQIAEAIRDPDEIWVGVTAVIIPDAQGGSEEQVIERKYIRVDPKTGLVAIFALLGGKWVAKTAFNPLKKRSVKTDVNQIDKRRSGVLVYKRK